MLSDLPSLAAVLRSLATDDRIFALALALTALGLIRTLMSWDLRVRELRSMERAGSNRERGHPLGRVRTEVSSPVSLGVHSTETTGS